MKKHFILWIFFVCLVYSAYSQSTVPVFVNRQSGYLCSKSYESGAAARIGCLHREKW